MNKKIIATTLSLATLLAPLSVSASTPVPLKQSAVVITPFSDPDPGASFTLIGQQNKTFDNSYDYSAISSAIGTLIAGVCLPASLGVQVAGGAATGVASNWVFQKLQVRTTVYSQVRLGLSYNSYLGYYEYVESVVHFNNSNYTSPIDVMYSNTGTRVPDATLAQYGLKNP